MKEIIAIIRPKKVTATKEALEKLGFPSITAEAVLGRGKQRGIASEVSFPVNAELLAKGKNGGMKFIPKRMISIVADNEQVDLIVKTLVEINQSATVGDGKIFVCPIDNAVRVRTGESGTQALI
ncbi:MAG TPA: P-II family nitrogen regulator [Fibrobacteraceae bacterium]|nr:P-II family nitrogen regulator [Fibrobacteraceae bacterium]